MLLTFFFFSKKYCILIDEGNLFRFQNYRTVEVGSILWRSSGPTLLLKQGHLEPVAQDHDWVAFENPHGWRLYHQLGNLFHCTVILTQKKHSKVLYFSIQDILILASVLNRNRLPTVGAGCYTESRTIHCGVQAASSG